MNPALRLLFWGLLLIVGPFVVGFLCTWAAIEKELERRRGRTPT
jgi:hypothetical protein